jgi:hypothetical protein
MLVLKRASKSRPSGEWSDDDYDVFDGDRHIGRIMWTHAGPADRQRNAHTVCVAAYAMMLPCAFDRLVPYRKPRVGAGVQLRSGT